MQLSQEILNPALDFARQYYLSQPDGQKRFDFAIKLVKQCNIIGSLEDLGGQEIRIAHFSALFLLAGPDFSKESLEGGSFGKALEFCRQQEMDEKTVDAVKACMEAVLPPQLPFTPAGQVLCDALNSFLVEKSKNPLDELHLIVPGIKASDTNEEKYQKWKKHLEQLVFFTGAAKKTLGKGIQKKLTWLNNQQEISTVKRDKGITPQQQPLVEELLENKPDRAAETLFRNASREHIAMLSIVHQKSGFLLSFNSILLSVVLSILSTKLTQFPHLLIPTTLLVATCLGTIIFTILATKPMIIRNRKDPLARDTYNAMFFGHYVHLNWLDYSKQLRTITADNDTITEVLAKNIYYQGVVLDKKYRLLSVAYKIFLFGLIISVSGFVFSFFQ